jgi:hypothetical protein
MEDSATITVESKKSQVNIVLDSSVMNTFEKCPTLMKYQYVDNLRFKGGKSKYLDKGDLLHIPLRHYYRQKQIGTEWEKCVEIAVGKMMKYGAKFIGLSDDDIKDVLTGFMSYAEFYRFERWTIIEVERPFRIILYEDNDLRIIIQGRIDLLVDTGQIIMPVDHKSESRRSEAMALSNQFMGYAYAAKSNNIMVNKIGFQTSLKAEEKYYRTLLSYDDDNLVEWREEFIFKVRELINYAEIDFFPHRYTSCQDKYGKCVMHEICHTPRVAREMKLMSQFEVVEPWDPFRDVESEEENKEQK